jgi:hypothetical protein
MSLLLPIVFLGVLASLSPSTIIVFILLLATARARVNAVAFLVGWSVSLTIVFAIGYFVGADHSLQHGGGHTALALIEILFGVALIYAAAVRWHRRHRPRTGSGVPKGVASRLRALNPWEATVLGVLMQPWTLTLAAAIVVVRHHLSGVVVIIAFLAFTAISTATVGVTFWYYSRHPGDAETRLSELRERVINAGPALFALVSLLVGTYLIVDGLVDLIH